MCKYAFEQASQASSNHLHHSAVLSNTEEPSRNTIKALNWLFTRRLHLYGYLLHFCLCCLLLLHTQRWLHDDTSSSEQDTNLNMPTNCSVNNDGEYLGGVKNSSTYPYTLPDIFFPSKQLIAVTFTCHTSSALTCAVTQKTHSRSDLLFSNRHDKWWPMTEDSVIFESKGITKGSSVATCTITRSVVSFSHLLVSPPPHTDELLSI